MLSDVIDSQAALVAEGKAQLEQAQAKIRQLEAHMPRMRPFLDPGVTSALAQQNQPTQPAPSSAGNGTPASDAPGSTKILDEEIQLDEPGSPTAPPLDIDLEVQPQAMEPPSFPPPPLPGLAPAFPPTIIPGLGGLSYPNAFPVLLLHPL